MVARYTETRNVLVCEALGNVGSLPLRFPFLVLQLFAWGAEAWAFMSGVWQWKSSHLLYELS
jgi:uncharacterized membrane protein YoaT (DUF817 family)